MKTFAASIADYSLAIICPMANEVATAGAVVEGFLKAASGFRRVCFFAVIDKASKDGTRDVLDALALKEARLKVVWAPENTCVVDAYMRGYQEALALEGVDWILEVDAGFSHRPEDLGQFFAPMCSGYEAIFGARFGLPGAACHSGLWRQLISRGGSLLANWLLGTRLSDMTSGYEMFRPYVLKAILELGIKSRAHFFQTEIKAFAHAYTITEVPITYQNPSPRVGRAALVEAFANLFMLRMRLREKGKSGTN